MIKTNNKTTGKAKCLIMAAALFILSVSQAWAYDFSVVVPSGQTLYFSIYSNNTVGVVWPNANATDIANIYDGYTEPTGNLVIPSSVTNNGTTYPVTGIGTAFANCEGLTSVTIPNTITQIYMNAFRNCTGLTSVTIGNSVATIENRVFQGCTSLTSVTIPNSVTSIGEYAFCGCTGLTSVTIGNSVTSIGNRVFQGCTSLTSVTIPNSVTSIGEYAFYECSGLTSVTIPNSVTSIGYCAFAYCTGLTSVTIGNSVASIGKYAFCGCTGLTTLNFNAVNCNNFSSTASNHQFYDCPISTINIGDSVQRIPGYFAYGRTSLISVTIPNSVTTIGYAAFGECTGLTSVNIPNSVTTIGEWAFDLVKNIIYSGTATGSPWGALNVNGYIEGDFIYSDNTKTILTAYIGTSSNVTIPNSVTTIESSAFEGCSGLTSVTIPNSVTTIVDRVFYGCSRLTTLNFNAVNCSDFIGYTDYSPFYGCPISTINIGDSVQRIPGYFVSGRTSLTSITIPNSVTSIGEYAFNWCTGLTSVTIPNSVTNIGGGAFNWCTGLTSVTIPNSVTNIGNSAFRHCTGLTSVTIPNSVTSIGEYAFEECSGLTSVTIPNSITAIGEYAFLYCTGLTSITIPNSVTSIGEYAFKYCSGLTTLNFNAVNCNDFYSDYPPFDDCPISTINIGDSVQRIPGYFVSGRTSLISVTIPNSVDSIGVYAFYNCTSIGRIDLQSVTPPIISSNSFQNVNSAIPVYIPCGSLSNYSNSNWGTRFPNLQESQVFSLGVAVNDSTMGMALILSNTCANTAIQAYAYDGYNFVGWSDGSTNNPRVVTLTRDTVFTAIFEANVQRYTITVMSANNNMGTVSGSGTYEEGTQATITATPAENHHFVSWNDGNTDNPRTITVTGDATYIASFAEDVQVTTYTITVMSANNNMGTVSGSGTYEEGTQATITATPTENHHFVSWNDGNTDNPRTITVTGDATYIANFAEDVQVTTYTITVMSANNNMGSVMGGGTYEEGAQASFAAIPTDGYRFVSWNDGNTDNPRTITVTGDAVYIASFAEDVSIDAANELDALTFHPNPTSGTITFNHADIRKVEVMDAMGRMVAIFENSNVIDLSKLGKGYYAMRITTDNGVAIRKVVRN